MSRSAPEAGAADQAGARHAQQRADGLWLTAIEVRRERNERLRRRQRIAERMVWRLGQLAELARSAAARVEHLDAGSLR